MPRKHSFKPLTDPRAIAAAVLEQTLHKNQPLEQALQAQTYYNKLETRDRAFVQILLKTTLRHLGECNTLMKEWLSSPLPQQATYAENVIRIGITQLLWLNTPPHAAIHTSVELIKNSKTGYLSGLVNALLNRAVKEGTATLLKYKERTINLPTWLSHKWQQAYGIDETALIAETLLLEPPLDITVKTDPELWAANLNATLLPNGSLRLTNASHIETLAGYTEGAWWVQDAAASLPVQLLGNLRGKRVLDMCAAPGGKTLQLAALGAHVTALDINAKRLRIVQENLNRTNLSAELIATDALAYTTDQLFDHILLDAPCSATGTLRRHPDVAWHRQPEDIQRLANTQQKLLRHALSLLKPGGTLAYAVCSMELEEGEEQISQALVELPNLKPIETSLPSDMAQKNKHGWRTLPSLMPYMGGLDGFFMTLLQKTT